MTFDEPEGATLLDPDDMVGLKYRHITTRGELNELEQANIQQGLLWLGRQRSRDVLSARFIRTLHERLFGDVWEWAGTFRQHETNIGMDPSHIAAQLNNLLDDARCWAENKVYVPLEAAARFHHRMVVIHLFPNGNGRHARIAADTYLEHNFHHPPVEWVGGFDLQADPAGRDAYLNALKSADRGEFRPLLEFVGLQR